MAIFSGVLLFLLEPWWKEAVGLLEGVNWFLGFTGRKRVRKTRK